MINDVCSEFKSGKNIKADSISESGEYPVYGGNGLRGYTSSYNHEGLYVLIGRQGALCGNIRSVNGKTYITEHAIAVAGNEKSNTSFLHYLFLKMNLGQFSDQSAQPGLAVNKLLKLKVILPSISEQTKIARLLSLLDECIATQNKIIEDLKKLKSAISKQAFAQKPNGWNRLDTLFSKGKAGGTPTSTNKEYYNGEIPFLSINDITKQGKYVRYTENHLSRSGLENSSAWVVPEYSLIISMYASVGLVTINEVPITTSQAMFAMQLRDKDLLDYLYYYLSYFKYRHIHKYLETGTQSNINADIVRGIMIPTYGHSRNMKIASTLQGIDAKIDNELSVLKLFNRQKNYLLSQMFI